MTQFTKHNGLFLNGFRPFFLGGSVFAGLAIPLWIAVFSDLISVGSSASPMDWHAHEMVFGFFGAILGGFLLTAMPNWTGSPALSGDKLLGLFLTWVGGRIAMLAFLLGDPSVPVVAFGVAVADLAYPVLLVIYAANQVAAAKAIHNLPVVIMVGLFGMANVLFHIAPVTRLDRLFGPHLALAVAAILIALIGGRIIPSFTRNWLVARSNPVLPADFSLVDKIALILVVVGMVAWVFAPDSVYTGLVLGLAAVWGLVRLWRWRGLQTCSEPLLLILHIGYLWFVASLAALSLNILLPGMLPGATALHVLTAGGIGVMILAVMTRVVRGHTGRPLTADRTAVAIYLLVNGGAVIRILAPWLPPDYATVAAIGGLLWSAAFLLFAYTYGPWLFRPKP